MVTNEQLNEAIADLKPILEMISNFQAKYAGLLKQIDKGNNSYLSTEGERNEAAIELLKKYADI